MQSRFFMLIRRIAFFFAVLVAFAFSIIRFYFGVSGL